MADYDSGHYFLTLAIPIDRDGTVLVDGRVTSVINHLRDVLAELPTSQQDLSAPPQPDCGFASVPGTHFVRLFVLGDVRYNGRRPSSPILNLLRNAQMTVPEQVDRLRNAYLIMTVDFDAPDGSDGSLRAYTDALWHHMQGQIARLFGPCLNFDQVKSAQDFFQFVRRCQVRTTMPFNDYWTSAPPFSNPLPLFAALAAGLPVVALVAWARGMWHWGAWGLVALTLGTVVALIVGITLKRGLTPFPPAPDSDLASILKAVYIQQMFTSFMTDNLGRGGQDLFDAFQRFQATHLPGDISGPTQAPGQLISKGTPP